MNKNRASGHPGLQLLILGVPLPPSCLHPLFNPCLRLAFNTFLFFPSDPESS